jgi:co-chaperonin GroES (HSP10)
LDRPTTIQLPVGPLPSCAWSIAAAALSPMPECAFVEMFPPTLSWGSLLLPDRVAGRLRPDAGTVLAVGSGLPDLAPGDQVLVMPYRGNWFEGFRVGDYAAEGQVRVYGVASMNEREHVAEDAYVSVRGKLGVLFPEAVGPWVFIRRDPVTASSGGVLLTDDEQFRSGLATVVSAGCRALGPDGSSLLSRGDRVLYHGNAIVTDCEFLSSRYELEGDPRDYVFVKAADVYAVVS